MRRNELAKHGWSVISGALLCFCAGTAAHAAPAASPVQIAIGNPMANAVVGGRISFSVAYDMGRTNIAAFAVFVDDSLQFSRPFITMTPHGIHYLELDTRQLPDGNHTVKISAIGPRGALAADVVNITVRNGIPGGPDLVPPLVQFRGLQDGDVVSGKVNLDILAEDNLTQDLLVSIFANQNPILIKNRPPYGLELDTTQFLEGNTGKVRLEVWAYDRAENLGKARPITLTVVPVGAATNQTRKQGDPTLPLGSKPMLPDVQMRNGLEPLLAPMQGSIVLPLGPRGQMPSPMMDPMPPAAAASRLEGRPKMTPGEVIPGSHPAPRMAKNVVPAIDPDYAPVGSASHSGLAAGKVSVPYTAPRPNSRPSTASAKGIDPIPATIADSPPVLGTTRATAPAQRPAAKGAPLKPRTQPRAPQGLNAGSAKTVDGAPGAVKMTLPAPQRVASAQTKPVNPEIAPAPVRSVEPVKTPSPAKGNIKIEVQPSAPSNMGAESPMPVPSVNPMPSPGGPRLEIPVTPPARAQKPLPAQPNKVLGNAPVIVTVVPKGATPNKDGRIPAQVYRIQSPKAAPTAQMPHDVEVRVAQGDTLESVARRYKVSPRAVMLANAITRPATLRRGSVLKVPGTFDVAMNGQSIRFDVTPRVENGLPLAPFRQIFEHAGGTVVWYPETQEVHAANDSKDIKLKIGSKEAVVNQMVVVMDKAAFVESGRTIVPISFMEKALDLQAEYDVKSGTIILARR